MDRGQLAMDLPTFCARLPKVDLHRHLEGALRLDTMLEAAHDHGIDVPADVEALRRQVQVQDGDPLTFQNFLSKFGTLRLFYRSPEIIHRITREAVEDAAADNIRYLELRFTPVALSRAERFPLHDVMDWVCASAEDASRAFGVEVRLIASVNRHEDVALAEQVAWLAAENRARGIVGLDLAGNEAEFSAEPFAPLFREARQAGLHITVHAGEWGGAENVRQAIELLGAERIGHGVRVLEDQGIVDLARERGVVFEVCPTSNYQSGVCSSLENHPLRRMVDARLAVTLNTDDPAVSNITLTDEYRNMAAAQGFSRAELKDFLRTAAEAAFLPEKARRALWQRLEKEIRRQNL